MIRHLTKADYRTMPWANGLGQTVEMIRVEKTMPGARIAVSPAKKATRSP